MVPDLPPRKRIDETVVRFVMGLTSAATLLTIFSYFLPNNFVGDPTNNIFTTIISLLVFVFLFYLLSRGHLKASKIIISLGLLLENYFILLDLGVGTDPGYYALLTVMQLALAALVWTPTIYAAVFLLNVVPLALYAILFEGIDALVSVLVQMSLVGTMPTVILLNIQMFKNTLDSMDELNQNQLDVLAALADKEREITDQKDRLSLIIESIADGLIVLNQEGELSMINDVALKMLGQKRRDVMGLEYKKFLHFMDDREVEQEIDLLEPVYAEGKVLDSVQHLVLVASMDKMIPVGLSVAPLKNEENEVIATVIIFRDETEERRQDQMKSDFVSVASHQLRTPLTAIKWNASLLEDLPLDDEHQQVLKDIKDSTERMITLVGSLLDLSRIERNADIDMHVTEFNLIEMVEDAVKENKISAKSRGVTFATEMPQDFKFKGDKNKLFQVINNLVSNAAKYSKENTEVQIRFKKTQSQIVLEVEDQGIGIPNHQQDRIFKKFFRADNAIKQKAEGNGIGLYLAKSYVEAHNGLLTFISIENKGTTFVITLPIPK